MLSIITEEETTNWFVFQGNKLIFLQAKQAVPKTLELFSDLRAHFVRQHFLGVYNKIPCHCAEVANNYILPSAFELLPMRSIFARLSKNWYGALAKSHAILNWDRNHQFCGACGAKNVS